MFPLKNRWAVLGLVYFSRTTMAIQFFSVPPLLTLFVEQWGISYAQAGWLISIAMLAGVVLALPSGLLSRRFGDKAVFVCGLALQALGAAMLSQADGFAMAITARALVGVGVVFLNVLATKIITEWFEGKELATGMAILVSSWPFGAAISLIGMAPLADFLGWRGAMGVVAGLSLFFFLAMLAFYRDLPKEPQVATTSQPLWNITRLELGLVILAGLVWSLPNAGFVIFNGFTPALLQEGRMPAAQVGLVVSLVSWMSIAGIPLGGWIADRTGRINTLIVSGVVVSAFFVVAMANGTLLWTGALGIGLGLCLWPGAIMTLPGQVLSPSSRATGFGVFYTVFYVTATSMPPLAGWVRDQTGLTSAPLYFGAVCFLASLLALVSLRIRQQRVSPQLAPQAK